MTQNMQTNWVNGSQPVACFEVVKKMGIERTIILWWFKYNYVHKTGITI